MTRNEYLIDLLMESADALMESAGRNGAAKRYYDERLKHIGYRKLRHERDNYNTHEPNTQLGRMNGRIAAMNSRNAINDHVVGDESDFAAATASGSKRRLAATGNGVRNKTIHDKINQRAAKAAKNEAIDILSEATDIMYGEY